ncbi:hypothetical protein CF165_37035 [Amycolatopsis vastitatis]|uniref:Uncharacterized protein n=1 Tax=Amycolatopsis vastitatis TaxID=1905142 RepID=A0A229SSU0_9PSEU|nr:hypothetical protein CF165_37035 [Amycolatopsis vastitatis]
MPMAQPAKVRTTTAAHASQLLLRSVATLITTPNAVAMAAPRADASQFLPVIVVIAILYLVASRLP